MDTLIWPLFELEVRSPKLTLRYIDDDLAAQLAELAARGIHDPVSSPFRFPWTDVPPPQLQRNTMQYYWRCRADTRPESWTIECAVEVDNTVVGVTGIKTANFAQLRRVVTTSWLGREFQGIGIGKEMRQATLTLGFDGFGADLAVTDAWHDNAPSIGVTTSLGYVETGRTHGVRRSRSDRIVHFEMSREHFQTIRRDDITLHGIEAVRELLCIEHSAGDDSAEGLTTRR